MPQLMPQLIRHGRGQLRGLALLAAVCASLDSARGPEVRPRRDDPCPCTGSPGDCPALADLYMATRGDEWANATGWCDGGSPCSWHGVTCCRDMFIGCPGWAPTYCSYTPPGWSMSILEACPASCGAPSCAVSKLGLAFNGLKGSVPGTIASLTNLLWLDLYGNSLSGSVPVEMGLLTKLAQLRLHWNVLSGTVPVELTSATALIQLSVHDNALSGTVPVQLASLNKLARLRLDSNNLSGTLPVELASLSELTQLYLSLNSLSGTVPATLASLSELSMLYLGSNHLSGTVPVELAGLTKLNLLTMWVNSLSGTVPVQLASLTELSKLYLSRNHLSGTVPVELASLAKLTALFLSTNNLSGTVPVQLASLIELSKLYLSRNHLSGTVPVELAGFTKLDFLTMSVNSLSGTVPVELASLSELSMLYLGSNHLSGTVPVELPASLIKLTSLGLSINSLSGTLPVGLASLTDLTWLSLQINRLSGTVPAELASLAKLTALFLSTNNLSGTVPVQLASLTDLTWLFLGTNHLSGTAPAELASLSELTRLALRSNSLSGTVPVQLMSLTEVNWLDLSSNSLSGTLPAQLASLNKLAFLSLGTNHLSSTVPVGLASVTALMWLGLADNHLSGTVPAELPASLIKLTSLYLSDNSLSGTVPLGLTSLTDLTWFSLKNNHLSGTVPVQLASLTKLVQLHLYTNSLSGTMPVGLAPSLEAVMLHSNHLSGTLPSFTNHSSLKALTLFGNSIGGRLRLPNHAPDLQVLVVHRNRLSCPVEYNSSSYNLSAQLSVQDNYTTGALIAPGNRLSTAAKPLWALMSGVHFQWDPADFWQAWQTELCLAIAGIIGSAAVIGAVLKGAWWSFFQFRPRGLYEQYSLLCLRLLVGLSACGLVLIPVYVAGSGEVECGQPWLGSTLAYLSGSPASEQAAAVLICVILAVQAFVAVAVRFWSPPDLELDGTALNDSLSWMRRLAVGLLWPVIALLLSLPAFLAVLAHSVPGDQNTLGLSQTLLDSFEYASAPLLTFIEAVLVPAAARALVGKRSPRRVVTLIALAQFTILLVVPFATALAFGSDCYGLWIKVWEPCSSNDSFNMAYTVPGQQVYVDEQEQDLIRYFAVSMAVTTHDEVCGSQPPALGRCPRYVIESLAKLLISKMAFNAFVTPVLSVVTCLPWSIRARSWFMKAVLRRSEYSHCLYLDEELAQVLSLMAGSIVLGTAVPEFTLLACLALAGRLAAVHLITTRLGVQFKEEHSQPPSWWWLLAAVPLSSALILWFFVSNAARIDGEMIACIGAPLALLLGLGGGWAVGPDLYGDKEADLTVVPAVVQFATLPSQAVIDFESRELL